MIPSDISSLLVWESLLIIISLIFLPLTCRLFSRFIDLGYIFSKVLGVALATYSMFFLGSIHVLPFSRISLIVILITWAAVLYWKEYKHLKQRLSKQIIIFAILEELLFLAGLILWTYVRSFSPDVHGLEKYMDFGFINSILRTEYFPPKDMWFTPFSINYYYFGHLVTASLTKLSGIPSAISFNLMLATIVGMCFSTTYSLASNLAVYIFPQKKYLLAKVIASGLLAAFLITFSGNLHTLYTFFKPYENEHPVPPTQLSFSFSTFPNSYWYPNATRFIFNTIHEFPIYSWVVADLHGHVLDIPFVLLTLGVLFAIFQNYSQITVVSKKNKSPPLVSFTIIPLPYHFLLGLLLAVMYMTNAWDGLIYLLLSSGVLFLISASYFSSNRVSLWEIIKQSIVPTVIATVILFVSFILFSLPFSLHFKPFVSGVGVLCAPKALTDMGKLGPLLFEADHCQHSPLWQLTILYGFFVFFTVWFLIFINKQKKLVFSDLFVLLLIFLSYILIIIPEFIYVKDIYPAHYRANTMFKLVFQSFMMLSISSGYIITRLLSFFKEQKKTIATTITFLSFFISTLVLLTLVFIYPFLATKSYYNNLQNSVGINGTKYLDTLYPDDAKAITWINSHISGQPVILEAQGDSYTDYGRISTNTGLPTVLGWTVHEWLWRGTYDIPAPRIAEVQNMYETPDLNQTKNLLQKYNVQYVYLGTLERQKYPSLDEAKWQKLSTVVYQAGNVKIYKIK